SKVRQTRAKAVVAKVSTSSSTPTISSDVAELKDMVRALLLDKENQSSASVSSPIPAPVKSVEPNCVTCGTYSYQNCPATSGNVYRDNIQNFEEYAKPGSESANPDGQLDEHAVQILSAPMPNLKLSISYPLRRDNERRHDQANKQIEKFYEIFKDMSFEISFTDALIRMPKFASTLKALIRNKEKLSEMARTSMNEHCLAIILNKLPRKLRDPDKFLIPCKFPGMDEFLALADLGASINLLPLSVWEGLSLSELIPTCMTLELADHSVSKPIGITKDVSVKVGLFYFPADFVVIDFEPDPRVLLILERCFLKNGRALIDVHKGELTLRIENKAITYNLDQTSSDFLFFQEADAFLGLKDDPNSPKFNPFYYDPEGDIILLEAILNTKTVKSSVNKPPEVELKDLPPHLEYAFLEGDNKLLVIIAKELGDEEKSALIKVLKSRKRAIAWNLSDIQEVKKLLDAGLIYPIFDSPWVSPVHCVPKKGGFTIVENEENDLIPTRLVIEWRVCIDYRKLNEATHKVHFPLPFLDQMLERLARNKFNCFLDGFSGYFQIPINPRDQEKTMFTCPYGTFAYRRMPFGLFNAQGTFQRCMLAIFHDMVEKTMEVFMDDFSLTLVIRRKQCSPILTEHLPIDACLSVCSMHRARFKGDFSKISRPMTHLLEKNTPFIFSEDCIKVFQTLNKKLTEAPILIAPNWDLPFELMCDASDFAIGAVLGQRHEKHFKPIHYASKTMNDAESNYTTTEKEMLAVIHAFEKFWSYLIMNKSIVHTDHSALKYLFAKKDAKARLLRWVLLLQEFDFKVLETKGAENLAAGHLSRLENPYENVLDLKKINETFPLETLSMVTFRGDSSAPCDPVVGARLRSSRHSRSLPQWTHEGTSWC
nr:hypothetical protein [Tanacetum cinerariifolium]